MNCLIETEIKKTLVMQRDLMLAGEVPPRLSDEAYLNDYYVNCEELSEPLAKAMVDDIIENLEAFYSNYEYRILRMETVGDYEKCTVSDEKGNTLCELCYTSKCLTSMNMTMYAIANQYPKLMVI